VGDILGDTLGELEGQVKGRELGILDGLTLGAELGFTDGISEGTLLRLGRELGLAAGDELGLDVSKGEEQSTLGVNRTHALAGILVLGT